MPLAIKIINRGIVYSRGVKIVVPERKCLTGVSQAWFHRSRACAALYVKLLFLNIYVLQVFPKCSLWEIVLIHFRYSVKKSS